MLLRQNGFLLLLVLRFKTDMRLNPHLNWQFYKKQVRNGRQVKIEIPESSNMLLNC